MNPEEMDREAERISQAVEKERNASERRAEYAAIAANAAVIERAAEAAVVTKAVEEDRCKQLDQFKGTVKTYQWCILAVVSALFLVIGILVPVWLDRPQIKYNTWRIDKIEVEYPKQMEALKTSSERNGIMLSENSEKLSEMRTMLIALRAQK